MRTIISLLILFSSVFCYAQVQVGDTLYPDLWHQNFGRSVDISNNGQRIAISSDHYNLPTNPGLLNIYHLENGNWLEKADLFGSSYGAGFGSKTSFSADGNRIAVSSPTFNFFSDLEYEYGKVQIFEYINGEWQNGAEFTGDLPYSRLGHSVSLSSDGNRLAYSENIENLRAQISIYDWNGTAWILSGNIGSSPCSFYDCNFRFSMSENGNKIVSQHKDDLQIQTYIWDNQNWVPQNTILNSTSSKLNFDLSDDGNFLVTGINSTIFGDWENRGIVQIYTWNNNNWTNHGPPIHGEVESHLGYFNVEITQGGNRVMASGIDSFNGNGLCNYIYDFLYNNWYAQFPSYPLHSGSFKISSDGNHIVLGNYYNIGVTVHQLTPVSIFNPTNQNLNTVDVSPNPSNGYFTLSNLDINKTTISVYCTQGKLIQTINKPSESLNLTHLNSGLYLLQIASQDFIEYTRIVIAH